MESLPGDFKERSQTPETLPGNRPVPTGPAGNCLRRWVLLLLGLAFISTTVASQSPTLPEDQVKALFLFNFTRYVEWPQETFPAADAPIVVGVRGNKDLLNYLEEIAAGREVQGRKIVTKNVTTLEHLASCHILFIAGADRRWGGEALAFTEGTSVLTVGEHPRFLESGGIINFVLREERVRLLVNLEGARRADLKLSSHLLRVADVVAMD